MLLDWPGFLGQPPRARGMSAVMGAYAGLRTALRAEGLFRPGAGAVEPDASAAGAALGELAIAEKALAEGISAAQKLDMKYEEGKLLMTRVAIQQEAGRAPDARDIERFTALLGPLGVRLPPSGPLQDQ